MNEQRGWKYWCIIIYTLMINCWCRMEWESHVLSYWWFDFNETLLKLLSMRDCFLVRLFWTVSSLWIVGFSRPHQWVTTSSTVKCYYYFAKPTRKWEKYFLFNSRIRWIAVKKKNDLTWLSVSEFRLKKIEQERQQSSIWENDIRSEIVGTEDRKLSERMSTTLWIP